MHQHIFINLPVADLPRAMAFYQALGYKPNAAARALASSGAARTGLDGAPAQTFLRLLVPGDYLAVLAYLGPDAACDAALKAREIKCPLLVEMSR